MSQVIITALDMSLTATGWATSHAVLSTATSGVIVPPAFADRGIARIRWIRAAVMERVHASNLVVIEGYAFGVQGQQGHISLGELGGVIRVALTDRRIPYVEIPPACVKLFATGKGNGKKDEVLAAAIRKLEYSGHDHNEADALWLLEMARAAYDDERPPANEAQRRAMAKIVWPRFAIARLVAEAEPVRYEPALRGGK
jgi:Holliday junction resolvasome RuvABC endonuclease subunit